MLHDKVYLWLVIVSCLALAVAGTMGIIELVELQDPTAASIANLYEPAR